MNHNDFWNKEPQKLKRGHEAIIWCVLVLAAAYALYRTLENFNLII